MSFAAQVRERELSVYDHSAYAAEGTYRKLHQKDMLWGGLAGLLAGAGLMVVFLAFDVLSFTPLATPAFLSSALPGGGDAGGEAVTELTSARIVLFSVLHLATFTLIGVVFARFFRFTALRKTLVVGALFGLIVCTAVFGAGLQVTGTQMSAEPGWPALLAGNLVAGLVMVVVLRRALGVDPPS
jgi:hypothetical protein